MSNKSRRISEMIAPFEGKERDAHYLAYFELFNQQLFFEAHDVLEELWLTRKGSANFAFYKGLIQLAGGFVHLQRGRVRPAAAVLGLAVANLEGYLPEYEGLEMENVLRGIRVLIGELEGGRSAETPLDAAPILALTKPGVVNVTLSGT